jgi:FAD:protein FMN transferase
MSREVASFRAMGVDVLVGGASPAERAAVRGLFEEWELAFSRFRADSELSAVNGVSGPVAAVSPLFARILETALAAAAATRGLVDPTLGVAIEAAGYDRDFEEVEAREEALEPTAPGRWRTLRLLGPLLWRPPGTRLDLNGVVKALAVDEALALLDGDGFVSAGGDVAVRGGAVVGLPGGDALRVREGGVATSGTTSRRWARGGGAQHHLIDPRTGRPARSRWAEVTVVAGSCLAADVAAKAAFLLSADGPEWLDEHSLAGRFVAGDDVLVNGAWRAADSGVATWS